MHGRSSQAGGCLLAILIFAGLGIGIAAGDPTKGAVIGTGAGIVAALLVWLLDRRRRGS